MRNVPLHRYGFKELIFCHGESLLYPGSWAHVTGSRQMPPPVFVFPRPARTTEPGAADAKNDVFSVAKAAPALCGVLLAGSASRSRLLTLFSQVDTCCGCCRTSPAGRSMTVLAEILSKENFRKMVDEAKDAQNNKETRAAEIAPKMFGLVPRNSTYKESGDLLAEQAAAFYDYKKKRLFVLDSNRTDSEQLIALARDPPTLWQINSILFENSSTTPMATSTARQAVIRPAMAELAYLSKKSGGKGEVPPRLLDRLADGAGRRATISRSSRRRRFTFARSRSLIQRECASRMRSIASWVRALSSACFGILREAHSTSCIRKLPEVPCRHRLCCSPRGIETVSHPGRRRCRGV